MLQEFLTTSLIEELIQLVSILLQEDKEHRVKIKKALKVSINFTIDDFLVAGQIAIMDDKEHEDKTNLKKLSKEF